MQQVSSHRHPLSVSDAETQLSVSSQILQNMQWESWSSRSNWPINPNVSKSAGQGNGLLHRTSRCTTLLGLLQPENPHYDIHKPIFVSCEFLIEIISPYSVKHVLKQLLTVVLGGFFLFFFYLILLKQDSTFVGCYFQRQINTLLGPTEEVTHWLLPAPKFSSPMWRNSVHYVEVGP